MNESAVKTKILDVASELFYTQGYNLTGINQIIEEAGIARASLYNHYKSKTELLIAYLKRADAQIFAEIDALLNSIADPNEKLRALIDYRLSRQKKMNFKGCQFAKISLEISREEDEAVREIANAHKKKFKKLLGQLVEQSNHKQILSDELLAKAIYLIMEGSSVSGAMTKTSASIKNARKIIDSLI